jgi:hypothetical protein
VRRLDSIQLHVPLFLHELSFGELHGRRCDECGFVHRHGLMLDADNDDMLSIRLRSHVLFDDVLVRR